MQMDFFGIGPLEGILVLLIAFIIFGPERLIEMSKSAGKTISRLSRSASSINQKLNQEIDIEEFSVSDDKTMKDKSEDSDTAQS